MRAPCFRCGLQHLLTYTAGPHNYVCFTCRRHTMTNGDDPMTAGTRVRSNVDGSLGTVTGTVPHITGPVVPQIRWDDRSSVRDHAVTPVDHDRRAA
jgi:hypothetical protein